MWLKILLVILIRLILLSKETILENKFDVIIY